MIKVVLDITFLEKVKSSDLLTFIALVLAYFAYVKNVEDKYKSWKSLLVSLKADIDCQSPWLFSSYSHVSILPKVWYSPAKVVYPLVFDSLKEIIRRGASDSSVLPPELNNLLSIFNERIEAFNQLLEHHRKLVTSNSTQSHNLQKILEGLGLSDSAVSDQEFNQRVISIKNTDNESYALSQNIAGINNALHAGLIGSDADKSSLNSLVLEINSTITEKLGNFSKIMPWFVKYKWYILFLWVIIFFLIENYLK